MNELQSEEVLENEIEPQEVDSVENDDAEISDHDEGAELAPASEGEHEENASLDDESQEAVNKRIGELTFKYRQEEREKAELQRQLQELQSKLQPSEPEMPQAPDPFDDDFDAKMVEYNDKLRQRYEWENAQKQRQEQTLQQQQAAQKQQLEQVQQQAATYAQRANELGIDKQRLANAGNTVAQYGLNNDLTVAILNDEQGPLITDYLASNVAELDQVVRMNPVQAAMHIHSQIKPKLKQLKPRESNTPKPPTSIKSSNVSLDDERYSVIKGATFE